MGLTIKNLCTPANLVTLGRIALLLPLAVLIRLDSLWIRLFCLAMIPVLFYLDSLDGYLARRCDCETRLGALLDIAGDRIVENVLWLVLAYLHLIPFWIPVFVLIRGFLTDGFRSAALSAGEKSTFSMMRSKTGWWLVASPLSRTLYAVLKAAVFTAGVAIWTFELDLYGLFYLLVALTLLHSTLRGVFTILESSRSLSP